MQSWIPISKDSNFSMHNIPYGICSYKNRVGACTALGDKVICLDVLQKTGLLPQELPERIFESNSLNAFMALDQKTHSSVRKCIQALFSDGCSTVKENTNLVAEAVLNSHEVNMLMPILVANYADFYSSIEHATNVGTMFRDANNPLLPNWKHIPIGYNGRASTVVVSGTSVIRPSGQTKADDDAAPVFGSTKQLDFELEMGTVIGRPSHIGRPVPIDECHKHIFGYVLLNDWSARDLQKWEYVPLGPFLAKSFATSISPWVVTSEALEPFRVPGANRDTPLLPYLKETLANNYDIHLEVALIPSGTKTETVICRTNFRTMYFSAVQQIAHLASNGTNLCTGDLYGSGTISGKTPDSYGSMLELCWKGTKPISLPDGSKRSFLQDGDTVIMRGYCQNNEVRVGFGEVRGTILGSA